MQKQILVKARKGFTLVEVALAVAVGLIIIGGAVLGYGAVKDNASNSQARDKVLSAVSMVEEYGAANGGKYPVSAAANTAATTGSFAAIWKNKRPDDYNASPWGGPTGNGNGTDEQAPFTGAAAAPASGEAITIAANGASQSDMIYASAAASTAAFGGQTASSTGVYSTFKNYVVGIFDKTGTAFWDVKGGK
jgi:prepilin-type N-terminal cleavage/methylation domain-containing protein